MRGQKKKSLRPPLKKKKNKLLTRVGNGLMVGLSILFLVISFALVAPDLYYRFFPADTKPLETQNQPLLAAAQEKKSEPGNETVALPEHNSYLPEGEWLVIPRIGVRTELQVTADPDEALQKGVWMSPEYGQPESNNGLPIILAAHRFGWEWWWQSEYWRYNSFYNLPDLEPGDLVEIISDQRKWVYEVYKAEQGEEITDYEADIILYTCKFLNSPVRYFRYAKRVEI